MDIKDVYIPDQNYQGTEEEELQHGRQWSEEAKERVRQARKAGRPVREMFASFYNKQERSVNKALNKVANRTIYKKSISNARNKLVVAKSNRDLSYKRGVALKNSSSGFVSRGSTPVEKGRRAGIVAKLKRDNDVDKMVKDATKAISKDVSNKVGKLSKDVGKGLNKTTRTIDRTITSAVNKGVENKDRKTIGKKEKQTIDAVKKRESLRLANVRKKEYSKINSAGKFDLLDSTRRKKKEKATKALDSKLSKENKVSQKRIKDTIDGTVTKNKYSSVGDIVSKKTAKTANSLKKGLKSTNKKLSKTIDDINTNKGKGYKLTGKTKVSAKDDFERYASDAERGDVYGKRKVSVIKEGKRANSITDALTGKTNDYKEYSTKTEYKMWKERKKKSKSKSKRKNKLRQSALNDVYIPGKVGTSEEVLKHSDFF